MDNCIHKSKIKRFKIDSSRDDRLIQQNYLDHKCDWQAISHAVFDERKNQEMSALIGRVKATGDTVSNDCAIYVIGCADFGVSKIGVSSIPLHRLDSLQGAHWADLRISAMYWASSKTAQKVEATALLAASEMGVRLRGEWIAMDSLEASELIWKAAKYLKADVADSAQALENMSARVEHLFNVRRDARKPFASIPA